MIWLWIAATLSARAGCADPAEAVDQARTQLLTLRETEAASQIAAAEEAFGCGPWAQPLVLARLWLAEGALASLGGHGEDATDAFAAAARIAPGLWDAAYGPALYEQYTAAAAVVATAAPGQLRVQPALGENEAWIDGRPFNPPGDVPAGLHLLQVGPPGGPALFARFFLVPAGEAMSVNTGLAGAEPAVEAAVTAPKGPVNLGPEAAAIRRAATRDWGDIESATRFPDAKAERLLKAYVRRYGSVTVAVDGVEHPVEIAQVREAQGRLDALPDARARLAANEADRKNLDKDFKSDAASARAADEAGAGLRGLTLVARGAWTQARASEQVGEGIGGLGARVGIGATFAFNAHLGARIELGYHSLAVGAPPSEDPKLADIALPPMGLRLGYGALAATWRAGKLEVQAGPLFALGAGQLPASAVYPSAMLEEADAALGTPTEASVRAGGGLVGVSWEGLGLGPLQLGPIAEFGALSDSVRLFPWGALGLTVRWRT